MFANLRFGYGLAAIVWMLITPMTGASAITVEVAKKCNALSAKAFPPRVVGNPAAGSAAGTSKQRREYFEKCVANKGKMDDDDGDKTTKPPKESKE